MTLEIFAEIEQRSAEWFALRKGLPTASRFSAIMAQSEERKMRAKYMYQLAAEILTGEVIESYDNDDMRRGREEEDDARRAYLDERRINDGAVDIEIDRVGFARDLDKGAGCSPDGLVGDDGALEIKSMRADLLIEARDKGVAPGKHFWQCQGALWVMGRQWCDLMLYSPRLRPLITRIKRDPAKCAELAVEVKRFRTELEKLVERMRG